MTADILYLSVMSVYAPGLIALIFWRKCWRFPIISFAFVGIFLFNAIGTISVFSDDNLYSLSFDSLIFSVDLSNLIILQSIIFYVFCGSYVYLRAPVSVSATPSKNDIIAIFVSISAIFVLASAYYGETGLFLVQAFFDRSMNTENAYYLRQEYVYGLQNWPFYNLGFVFIPIILANYGLLIFLSRSRRHYFASVICFSIGFAASFSLGSKGGLIGFLLSLSITYVSFLGMTGRSPYEIFRSRAFMAFALFAITTMFVGYIHATHELLTYNDIVQRILYRIFVAYPETLGAAISLANNQGVLDISVLPTMRGLLPHDQANLSAILHQYQANSPGGVSVPFAGEAYLIRGWKTVLIVVPLVFLTLVVLQEFAFLLKGGLLSIAFSALYSYLAVQLSLNGMFASLFNFMYPGTIILIGIFVFFIRIFLEFKLSDIFLFKRDTVCRNF